MNTVRIQKTYSKRTPWELFQGVHALCSVAFFLDSPAYQPPSQRFSYIGWNPTAEIKVTGKIMRITERTRTQTLGAEKLLTVLRRLMKKYGPALQRKRPFFSGGAVGFWGYEAAGIFEPVKFRTKKRWGGIPDLHLGIYHHVLVFDHQKKCYYLISNDFNHPVWTQLKAFMSPEAPEFPEQKLFRFSRYRPVMRRSLFEKAVRRAKRYIAQGDIYQANLSQRFKFNYSGSPLALYGELRRINPSPFSVFYKMRDLEIVSSSPERLVSKRGRLCETQPIAGTRPRIKGREKRLLRELLTNEKEKAEHLMLVDLERNDLGRVCAWPSVRVKEFMTIEKYSHVMHLVSRITGRLSQNYDVWDLIQAMFPGGTITGCPKIRCMEIIDELEPETRGIYTGSIGYVDFNGDADLNIIIRTLVLKGGRGFYQTGAGIVHDSLPEREYEETLHKAEALKEALRKAGRQ